METRDFLFELGTEELPPKALQVLSQSLKASIEDGLNKADLSFASSKVFASPRRLAIIITGLVSKQAPRELTRTGPNVQAAFASDGTPTLALMGFARSCGVSLDQVERVMTEKGEYVQCKLHQTGKSAAELLPEIIKNAIKKLPIPKPMRWGEHNEAFIRPVHWIVMLLGTQVIPFNLFGLKSSRLTYGHRFLSEGAIELEHASEYSFKLKELGFVIADFNTRKNIINEALVQASAPVGQVVIDPELLDEVTALVEWPVALLGEFNRDFLAVPKEALVTSMKSHQKVFPVVNPSDELLPYFVLVSNIISTKPETVMKGNERVIRARLSDAQFFFEQDKKQTLYKRHGRLNDIVFTHKLGSLGDKTHRVALLCAHIAKAMDIDPTLAKRAGELSKCDLLTEMVGEFPSLQGTMGYYYANADGENESVAIALREQYQPRFAKDHTPNSELGACLALADKIDTLVGIIGIKQMPTGDKDPFALRRAALGVMRILIETPLALDLADLIKQAKKYYKDALSNDKVEQQVYQFCMDRLRAWYLDRGMSPQHFEAVMSLEPSSPLDFDRRIHAVRAFGALEEAQALAAANKRVHNILKKQKSSLPKSLDAKLFEHDVEKQLVDALMQKQDIVASLNVDSDYEGILKALASLKDPVDAFFDDVMIMADDKNVRENRLLILQMIRDLFTQVADISLLQ